MPKRQKKLVLDRPEQLRAVASPTANRIVGAMERMGTGTVADIAERLGMPAESLYYHVRKLAKVGVLSEQGRRASSRRDAIVYEFKGSEIHRDTSNTSPAFLRELARSSRTMLRLAERLNAEAIERGEAASQGTRRTVATIQQHARLSAKNLAEVNRRLEQLAEFIIDADDPTANTSVVVTLTLAPDRGA